MVPETLYQKAIVPIMAGALVANIFVFVPFTIFLGNTGEFTSSIWSIIRLLTIPGFSLLIVLISIGWLFPAKLKDRYTVLLASLGLLVWFQSNVLLWDYGILDGRSIDWAIDTWRGWIDSVIWLVVLVISNIFYLQVRKNLTLCVLVLFFIQTVHIGYIGVVKFDLLRGTARISAQDESLNNIYKFSSEQNVVHLMLDGFQADVFSDLIKQDAQYKSSLTGFTFFEDTLGTFPYTRFAVPAFLAGKIYNNKTPKDEFVTAALKGNSILNAAHASGYEVDIVGEEYWVPFYTKGNHTNNYTIPNNQHMTEADFLLDNAATLLDLTLFRIAPHFVKEHIYNKQKWLVSPFLVDKEFLQFHYFSHTSLVESLTDNMSIGREKPTYKYIHIMNTHTPMVVTSQCVYAGGVLPNIRSTLTDQSKCTLNTIMSLLEKMKSLGIYDDALIVLHADHGGWVHPHKFKRHRASNGMIIEPWMASLSSPLLAVKPPQASGDLVVSDKRATMADLPDTISSILELEADFGRISLIGSDVDPNRKRRFYFYAWQRDAWETDYTGPIQEFIIDGSQHEQAWIPGRVFDPPVGKN